MAQFIPPEPRSVGDTGLSMLLLSELALKTLYITGQMSGFDLAHAMRLPFPGVVSRVIDFLKRDQYLETRGAAGVGEGSYQYSATDKGGAKAREMLAKNQYVGPAPVPVEVYRDAVKQQGSPWVELTREGLQHALAEFVLSPDVVDALGPAITSRRSLLLYGASGNGKTAAARAMGEMLCKGAVYIPYAIEAGGELILVFDDALHQPTESNGSRSPADPSERVDQRWAHIYRPVALLGAATRLEGLDLYFDELSRCYVAPPQIKANGGVVIMDDLGRQSTPARELLNRWLVPMDGRSDYLTLRTGRKIEVPFEAAVIFATHLAPSELADEALLRRIRHKVEMRSPGFDEYRQIFRRACERKQIPYDERALAYLLQKYYVQPKRPMRASHPEELLSGLVDIAEFEKRPPSLETDLLDRACRMYFGQMTT